MQTEPVTQQSSPLWGCSSPPRLRRARSSSRAPGVPSRRAESRRPSSRRHRSRRTRSSRRDRSRPRRRGGSTSPTRGRRRRTDAGDRRRQARALGTLEASRWGIPDLILVLLARMASDPQAGRTHLRWAFWAKDGVYGGKEGEESRARWLDVGPKEKGPPEGDPFIIVVGSSRRTNRSGRRRRQCSRIREAPCPPRRGSRTLGRYRGSCWSRRCRRSASSSSWRWRSRAPEPPRRRCT